MELWGVLLCSERICFVYEWNPAVLSTFVWLIWADMNNHTTYSTVEWNSWMLLGVNLSWALFTFRLKLIFHPKWYHFYNVCSSNNDNVLLSVFQIWISKLSSFAYDCYKKNQENLVIVIVCGHKPTSGDREIIKERWVFWSFHSSLRYQRQLIWSSENKSEWPWLFRIFHFITTAGFMMVMILLINSTAGGHGFPQHINSTFLKIFSW